jgi:hypothetical protein
MLKRNINQYVNINPYLDTSGTIIATKENHNGYSYDNRYDYMIKWNHKMEKGCGEYQYYDEKELDFLEKNWNMVKGVK